MNNWYLGVLGRGLGRRRDGELKVSELKRLNLSINFAEDLINCGGKSKEVDLIVGYIIVL